MSHRAPASSSSFSSSSFAPVPVEALEPRRMFAAGDPTAVYLPYIKTRSEDGSRVFAILYNGPNPIDRSTLGTNDLLIFGDNDFLADTTFLGSAPYGKGNGLVARYRVDGLPSGGQFKLFVNEEGISDAAENLVIGGTLGGFAIDSAGRTIPQLLSNPNPTPTPTPTPTPMPPPSVSVIGTQYGSVSTPPPLNSTFGTVVQALNFGATSVASVPGFPLPFEPLSVTGPTSPVTLKTSPFSVSLISDGGNDVSNATVGGHPVFTKEIFSGSGEPLTLSIEGLDPSKRYRFQFLHGDGRAGQFPYFETDQILTIADDVQALAPLQFNTSAGNAFSNTTVEVQGTAHIDYRMPPGDGRGPSFSGVIISVAPPLPPAPATTTEVDPTPTPTPTPTPRPVPVSGFVARVIRPSIRLGPGSSQTFDVLYTDPTQPVPVTALVGRHLFVTGPRGYSGLATFVNVRPGENGSAIARYRIEGVEATGSYTLFAENKRLASVTLFYLRPVRYEMPAPPDETDGGGDEVTA